MTKKIAFLIDGEYFLRRLRKLVGVEKSQTPKDIAHWLKVLCRNHVRRLCHTTTHEHWHDFVYRIFFYDAHPYTGKAHHPIHNHTIEFAKTQQAQTRLALFEQLKGERKLALRLGKVSKERDWTLNPELTKPILQLLKQLSPDTACQSNKPGEFANNSELHKLENKLQEILQKLQSQDKVVKLPLKQKGVDMRIGIDIASMTLKKQVDTIVLVAGDSDFVPAAKLARREGVEFILDPLWQSINSDLREHIDDLQSGISKTAPQTLEQQGTDE